VSLSRASSSPHHQPRLQPLAQENAPNTLNKPCKLFIGCSSGHRAAASRFGTAEPIIRRSLYGCGLIHRAIRPPADNGLQRTGCPTARVRPQVASCAMHKDERPDRSAGPL
jgi:hypothetical protein